MTKGLLSILLFWWVVLAAEGCKNNDEVFPKVTYAELNIVNASADTLNFYLDGTRQNNMSSISPTGQTGYLSVPAGNENLQFKKAGSFNILFSQPATLIDTTYSVFIAGTSSSDCFITIDYLGIDTVTNTTQIRFVNASPDAGPLTVSIDSSTYQNNNFKSISQFIPYGSGPKEIKVFRNGSATASVDTIVTFEPQSLYTIYSKGLVNGKGNAVFDVGVAVNYTSTP